MEKQQFPLAMPAQVIAITNCLATLDYEDEEGKRLNYRVTVEPITRNRSLEQNRLAWLWHGEAAEQLKDESAEDKRAYCKLHFGVPILRSDDEEFRHQYDEIVKPHKYELKLKFMKSPVDFPVTSLMKVRQMSQYLEDCCNHYRKLGVQLTDPSMYGENFG